MTNIVKQVARLGRKILTRIIGERMMTDTTEYYKNRSFLDGYASHTDARVSRDPKAAIGGMWDEIGQLQFQFLKQMGLKPEHKMLDIGCGTLRGGRFFISYLNTSNYTGIDISPACIDAARSLVEYEDLEDKSPTLILNERKSMQFEEFEGQRFDFLLAQSVFTHLPESVLDECLANIGKIMGPQSHFYFTYIQSDKPKQFSHKDFSYPWAFFESLARKHGFDAEEISDSYDHPRNQKMGVIRKISKSNGE